MSRFRSLTALSGAALLALVATRGVAQPAPPKAAANAEVVTPLEGLTVAVSKTPPAVVITVPAAGATVDPGVLVLKITFDQHMDPDSWRYAKGADGDYPDCLAKPRLLADAKTFVLLCTVRGGRAYSVRINDGGDQGFANIGRRTATPFELQFTTAKGHPVSSLPDALKVAGLKDDEGPIENAEIAATK